MNPTVCKYCNGNLKLTVTPSLIHFGRLDCESCLRFNGWARNPDSSNFESKRIGNRADINKVAAYHEIPQDDPICFFCLRKKEQLGEAETLTVDHIRELDTAKQGEDLDQVFNMQILCSACHKLKNWTRLYMNWHLNGKNH